jgi:soluble lytic murein transglycosylase-like protein
MRRLIACHAVLLLVLALGIAAPGNVFAGAQQYAPLADSVKNALHSAISDQAPPEPRFPSIEEKIAWLTGMSQRLARKMPDNDTRLEFLKAVYHEATRAGLDPQLVLGLVQVESNFRKHAVSHAGARGFMQVMPFWIGLIGNTGDNLFNLRTNLRYGCTILRHYLDMEQGDLYRALGRYNGSLGQPDYPRAVEAAWKRNWGFAFKASPTPAASASGALSGKI